MCGAGVKTKSWAIAFAAILCGCSSTAPSTEPSADARAAALTRADWNRPTEVRIDLRDYGFAPSQLRLKQGQAYRLTVFNSGGVAHYFNAPELLRAIAARHVVVTDQVEIVAPQFSSFEVARRGGSFALEFVPLVNGTYRAYCHLAGDEHKDVQGHVIVE